MNLCLCGCGNYCRNKYYKSWHVNIGKEGYWKGKKRKYKDPEGRNKKISKTIKSIIKKQGYWNSPETRLKLSKIFKGKSYEKRYGKKRALEIKNKISKNNGRGKLGTHISKKHKQILSKRMLGDKNPMKKKKVKQKQRQSQLNRFIRQGYYKCYNESSIPFFRKINKLYRMNAFFGKYEKQVIGYSLDFYSVKYNLVIEWNEERHYESNKLSKKHLIRQNNIKRYLKCKFINIRQKTFNEQKQLNKIKKIIKECKYDK